MLKADAGKLVLVLSNISKRLINLSLLVINILVGE